MSPRIELLLSGPDFWEKNPKKRQPNTEKCLFSALSCPTIGSFTPKASASKASDLLKWKQQLPAHSLHQNNFSFSTELGTYTLYNIQIMCIPILLLIYTYKNACHLYVNADTHYKTCTCSYSFFKFEF